MYRHIIWDWNGTLIDDTCLCLEITNQMLRERDLPEVELHRHRDLFDLPISVYYERIGFDFDADPMQVLNDEFAASYAARRAECGLHHPATDILGGFAARGYAQSVLSAYPQDALEDAISYFRLSGYFSGLFGHLETFAGSKLGRGADCLSATGHDPADVVLVGDTVHDWEVATHLGIACILLSHGHQSRTRLESCGVPVLDSLSALQDILPGIRYPGGESYP
jgi:phosphoglycolate phosphatase